MSTGRNNVEDADSDGVVSLKAARRTLGNLGGATEQELRQAQETFTEAATDCLFEMVKRRAAAEPEAKEPPAGIVRCSHCPHGYVKYGSCLACGAEP